MNAQIIYFERPTQKDIETFLAQSTIESLSYPSPGATRDGKTPRYFALEDTSCLLGSGSDCFKRACDAMRQWKMFALPGLTLHHSSSNIQPGEISIIEIKLMGIYFLNACKIAYVIHDESETVSRFGFANGTLKNHLEVGEELFLIEHNKRSDAVTYRLFSYSRPRFIWIYLAYPWARYLQKRFVATSLKSMQNAAREA